MACTHVIQFEDAASSVAVAPDGQLLAVGLWGGGVHLLDAHSGVRHANLDKISCLYVDTVAFSPASASQQLLLVASFSKNTVRVWDCTSSACIAELQGHPCSVYSVAFSPDGRMLASASSDSTVRLWRTDDWRAPPAELNGHSTIVFSVAFSCDGAMLASCSLDQTVKLWHIPDRNAAAAPAAATATGPTLEADQQLDCVAFSPVDSRLLACGGTEGFLVLARVGGDGVIAVERKLQGHTDTVRSLAFSPCGRMLATVSRDHTVRLWSVANGACLRVLRGHTDEVRGVAFFPNGKQLASGSDDKTVRIWTLCAWSDKTHRLFGAPLKASVFTLMCVRAWLEQYGPHSPQLPRLPMEVWLLVFEQLHLATRVMIVDEVSSSDSDS